MAAPQTPVIEPLGRHHDRNGFSCGEPALDEYLRQRASQDTKRRVAQVFVALGSSESEIAGYYTLSAAAFRRDDLPPKLAKRLPHYPIPAAVLGRLAVSSNHQGRGLGEHLLTDALHRVIAASNALAINAVIVDAKNEAVKAFYQRYGFQPFPKQPMRLFLPLSTLAEGGTPQDVRIQIKQ